MAKKRTYTQYDRERAIECQTALHGDDVMWTLQTHGYYTDGGVVSCMSGAEIGKILDLSTASILNVLAGLINEGRLKRIKNRRAAFFIEDKFLS